MKNNHFLIHFRHKLFVVLFCVLLYACKRQEVAADNENLLRDAISQINQKEAINNELLFSAYEDDGRKIKTPLGDSGADMLVLRTTDTDCDLCIDSVMSVLKNGKWGEKIRIQIWVDIKSPKSYFYDKPWYKQIVGVNFLTLPRASVGLLNSEKQNKPFFFMLSRTGGIISHVYFPDVNNITNLKRYLAILEEKFFKGKEN